MSNGEIVQINAEKISNITGFPPEVVAIVKNTVAKGTTDTELAFFLSICKSVNLNPLNKEIWCYKDSKGNLLSFAGRDGFLKRAQESPLWNGMTSFVVYSNDFFEMDVAKGIIQHKPNFKDRGSILGAYAIVKPKGAEFPTIEWADFATYNKGYNTWKADPAAMIVKVAESHSLKKAFGITVLQSEHDYEIKNDIADVIDHTEIIPEQDPKLIEELKITLSEFDNYVELKNKAVGLKENYMQKGLNEITAYEMIRTRLKGLE